MNTLLTPQASSPAKFALIGLALAGLAFAALPAHAATRCTNAAGAVAYTDSACPAGYQTARSIAPMPVVSAADQAGAKAQATKDRNAVDAFDQERAQQDKILAREQAKAAKQAKQADLSQAKQAKTCKVAQLALQRAQDKYDSMPDSVVKSQSAKPQSKAGNRATTHTVIREGDTPTGKARKKARKALETAQVKRDMACA